MVELFLSRLPMPPRAWRREKVNRDAASGDPARACWAVDRGVITYDEAIQLARVDMLLEWAYA